MPLPARPVRALFAQRHPPVYRDPSRGPEPSSQSSRITISHVDDFLFVYGTLRSEFENPHALRLRAGAQLIGPATVRGAIFKVADYPGYRPTPEAEVRGELYRIANPAALLKTLDAYE